MDGRGFDVTVYVDLSPVDHRMLTAFEAAVQEVADIVECPHMVSKSDYLLRVAVAVADLAAYERLYVDRLASPTSPASPRRSP